MSERLRLTWRRNGERMTVAAAANRLAAHGATVRADAHGDFILAAEDGAARALDRLGLHYEAHTAPVDGRTSAAVRIPRIAIFAGRGSAYPYYAYYAHCLLALGVSFTVVDAPDIVAGALDSADLLVLPGGFAIWGLDRCEGTDGADDAVRRFVARGGTCIGSCGGAYYLSQGRPGWLGLAPASPRYTHEYLSSGAGIVSVVLQPGPLSVGCAPAMEMPYYHGPIYEAVRGPAETAAAFCALTMPARLPIDNPLDAARFAAEMAGKPAILTMRSQAGSAVLFSPHPEMGDLVRKYVAVGSYVARYLPIRGMPVMEQTLDFYTPNDAPAFRLVLNAVQFLSGDARGAHQGAQSPTTTDAHAVLSLIGRRLDEARTAGHPLAALLRREIGKLTALAQRLRGVRIADDPAIARVLADAVTLLSDDGWPAKDVVHQLLDIELPLRFIELCARQADIDASIQKHAVPA